jgi:hypothetical protein
MSKIERLDLFRINRQAQQLCRCELPRFEIDTKNRIIRCEICGAILDPFEAFHKVALHFERIDDHCKNLQEIIEEYEKVRYVGRFKEFASEHRKGMLPVCPKCDKAFDFMDITEFRNKEYLAYLESEEE